MDGDNKVFDFIGWVPCVGGRLFFEFTCCGLGAKIAAEINHIDPADTSGLFKRYIVISSEVDWKDSENGETSGKYTAVLCGEKSSDEINLTGIVALIPEKASSSTLPDIQKKLYEMNKVVSRQGEIGELYSQLVSTLEDKQSTPAYIVSFVVESLGFTKLKYQASEGSIDEDPIHKFTLTRQAYYYIKYSFHKHRHHHDKAESLTTIHNLDTDKHRLGIKMLNDLRKSLVQIKRDSEDFDCDNLFRAGGIAAYAKTLAESCYRNGYLTEEEYKSELSYFSNIGSSVQIMSDASTRELTKSLTVSSNARAIVIFIFSLVAPVIIIFREQILNRIGDSSDLIYVKIISEILSSDVKAGIVVFLLVAFYFIYIAINVKFGRVFLAFKWYRHFLHTIVFDHWKAIMLVVLTLILPAMLILYGLTNLLGN